MDKFKAAFFLNACRTEKKTIKLGTSKSENICMGSFPRKGDLTHVPSTSVFQNV